MHRKHGDRRSCARGQAKGNAGFAPLGAVVTLGCLASWTRAPGRRLGGKHSL